MKSAMLDFPDSGIEIVSTAWSSSSEARINLCNLSTASDGLAGSAGAAFGLRAETGKLPP
jgi:hypothetical protein